MSHYDSGYGGGGGGGGGGMGYGYFLDPRHIAVDGRRHLPSNDGELHSFTDALLADYSDSDFDSDFESSSEFDSDSDYSHEFEDEFEELDPIEWDWMALFLATS